MRGKFIVLEGLDGSGKTTQIKLLGERLNREGLPCVVQAEPTGHEYGKICREILSGKKECSPTQFALLFTVDRIEHNINETDGIMQYLDRGINVICDRYYYSTFCYQGMDVEMKYLEDLNLNCKEILTPDLMIFLDLLPEKSMERIEANRRPDEKEIFENVENLTRIRERFLSILNSTLGGERIEVVSADASIEEIHENIYKIVRETLD